MYLIVGNAAGGNAGNADNVKNLNIIVPNGDLENTFLHMFKNSLYEDLDRKIFELYGLNNDEIMFIEAL